MGYVRGLPLFLGAVWSDSANWIDSIWRFLSLPRDTGGFSLSSSVSLLHWPTNTGVISLADLIRCDMATENSYPF